MVPEAGTCGAANAGAGVAGTTVGPMPAPGGSSCTVPAAVCEPPVQSREATARNGRRRARPVPNRHFPDLNRILPEPRSDRGRLIVWTIVVLDASLLGLSTRSPVFLSGIEIGRQLATQTCRWARRRERQL